jgi:hypothetical protein
MSGVLVIETVVAERIRVPPNHMARFAFKVHFHNSSLNKVVGYTDFFSEQNPTFAPGLTFPVANARLQMLSVAVCLVPKSKVAAWGKIRGGGAAEEVERKDLLVVGESSVNVVQVAKGLDSRAVCSFNFAADAATARGPLQQQQQALTAGAAGGGGGADVVGPRSRVVFDAVFLTEEKKVLHFGRQATSAKTAARGPGGKTPLRV